MNDPSEVMFLPEVAQELGISEKAMRRRVDDGRSTIPPAHRGPVAGHASRVYWLRSEVNAWLRGARWPGNRGAASRGRT